MPAVQRLRGQPLRHLGVVGSRRRVATCAETSAAADHLTQLAGRVIVETSTSDNSVPDPVSKSHGLCRQGG
jgi:hypothetical protein